MYENVLPDNLDELKELILSGDLNDNQLDVLIKNHCHAYLEFEEKCELCEFMAEGEGEDAFRLMEQLIEDYSDRMTDDQIDIFRGPDDNTFDEWFPECYMGADGWRESRARGADLLIQVRTSKNARYGNAVSAFYTFIYVLEQYLFDSWYGSNPQAGAKELIKHLSSFPECSEADLQDLLETFHNQEFSGCDSSEFEECETCQDLLRDSISRMK